MTAEAEGVQLHMSDHSATGYKHVFPSRGGIGYRAILRERKEYKVIGGKTFDFAVDAAVAVARYFLQRDNEEQGDDREQSEQAMEEEQDKEPEQAQAQELEQEEPEEVEVVGGGRRPAEDRRRAARR